jgi:uncharacterized protein YlbG (UPF0298 family)
MELERMIGEEYAQLLYNEYGDEIWAAARRLAGQGEIWYEGLNSIELLSYITKDDLEMLVEEINAIDAVTQIQSSLDRTLKTSMVSTSLSKSMVGDNNLTIRKNLRKDYMQLAVLAYGRDAYEEQEKTCWADMKKMFISNAHILLNPIVHKYGWPWRHVCYWKLRPKHHFADKTMNNYFKRGRSVHYFHTDIRKYYEWAVTKDIMDIDNYTTYQSLLFHPLVYLYYNKLFDE